MHAWVGTNLYNCTSSLYSQMQENAYYFYWNYDQILDNGDHFKVLLKEI